MGQEPESNPQEGQEPTPAPAESKTPEPTGEKVFDAAYVAELRKEAAKYRTEAQEAKGKAEEYENAQKSELEKAQGKLSKVEQAKSEAEAKLLRYEVAQEKEVPAKLVPLLTGSTKEELESQANLILENVKAGESKPDFDGGAREPVAEPLSPEAQHNKDILGLFGIAAT
jgi:hypothetical protein